MLVVFACATCPTHTYQSKQIFLDILQPLCVETEIGVGISITHLYTLRGFPKQLRFGPFSACGYIFAATSSKAANKKASTEAATTTALTLSRNPMLFNSTHANRGSTPRSRWSGQRFALTGSQRGADWTQGVRHCPHSRCWKSCLDWKEGAWRGGYGQRTDRSRTSEGE